MKKKEYFLLSNCLWLERRRLYLYIKCQGVSLGSSLIIPCSPSHRTQPIYETSATSKLQVPTYLSLAFSTQVQLRWEYSSVQIQQTFQLKRLFFPLYLTTFFDFQFFNKYFILPNKFFAGKLLQKKLIKIEQFNYLIKTIEILQELNYFYI